MSDPYLRLAAARKIAPAAPSRPLGRLLVDAELISATDLMKALHQQHKLDAQLGDILIAEGLVSEGDVLDGLALQHSLDRVDLGISPSDMRTARALPSHICLEFGIVPWRWIGDTLLVATSRPGQMDAVKEALGHSTPPLIPVVASPGDIQVQLGRFFGAELAAKAVERVPEEQSARQWHGKSSRRGLRASLFVAAFLVALILAPIWVLGLLLGWCVFTLLLTTGLKTAAFFAQVSHNLAESPRPAEQDQVTRLPTVSVIVPLFREKEIAQALIKRLERLSYPKSLLNVVLALEAKDTLTRETIARTKLPHWISVIEVPDDGTITTKPRALNYALDFCRGSIIGVWDAEDAPEPDQIEKVVARFRDAPENVACLQGMLDYYNSRDNWIARCFSIEYATWWRMIMPGMARLGLAIPLGGTTLFFRRDILTELGGWDAHNVTEDADLGIRLARQGYVTELLQTVTTEEANCRAWPWVRQRSRWLKGFLVTYCVHMRRPRQLLQDLGWRRTLGLQIVFLATFSQFAALPLLWTFWLPVFGLPHPMAEPLGHAGLYALGLLFLFSELINIVIGMSAVSGQKHRHLLHWVITMPFYFTLAAFASYKALYEIILRPFYWDKTQHGIST